MYDNFSYFTILEYNLCSFSNDWEKLANGIDDKIRDDKRGITYEFMTFHWKNCYNLLITNQGSQCANGKLTKGKKKRKNWAIL